MSDTHQFLVVENLFKRYVILVEPIKGITSVYCTECEEWVAQYTGEQFSTQSQEEFLEKIVEDHRDDFPDMVEFDRKL